jgi:hypothetical protein
VTIEQLTLQQLIEENESLKNELRDWKNHHATEVRRARILKERTDMPIERVQAYEKWGKDLEELAQVTNLKNMFGEELFGFQEQYGVASALSEEIAASWDEKYILREDYKERLADHEQEILVEERRFSAAHELISEQEKLLITLGDALLWVADTMPINITKEFEDDKGCHCPICKALVQYEGWRNEA